MNEIIIQQLDWMKMDNLIPAIIQDAESLQVLMLGYVSPESLQQTLATSQVTFYSRSKKRLWTKGEISKNFLEVVDVVPDCDNDAILILVKALGPTCHLGTTSCFKDSPKTHISFLEKLEKTIKQRYLERPEQSYTTKLFNAGIDRIAQKVGEEAIETVIATLSSSQHVLANEAADLVYHLLVLLSAKETNLVTVVDVLKNRKR